MRVYVGGLFHEANAFSPIATPLSAFRILGADDRLAVHEFGYSDLLIAVRETGDTAIPGFYAEAQPSAPCSAATFEILLGHMLQDLAKHPTPEAVLLFLHGAQSAEGHDDCAAEVTEAFRRTLGPAVPIGVVHDLHANLSPRTIAAATFVAACKEYPHIDFPETCRAVWDQIRSGRASALHAAFHRVPAFPAATTLQGVMKDFVTQMRNLEPAPGTISAIHGFAPADVPHSTAGVLAYAGTAAEAHSLAAELARRFFEASLQAAQTNPGLSVDEAVERAANWPGPVVIADRSDNPGAGAAGDGTHLLRAFSAYPNKRVAIVLMHDPEAVQAAHAAGEGVEVALSLGGRANAMSGRPLDFNGRVTALRRTATQEIFGSIHPLGDTALLVQGNLHVVVNTLRQQPFTPDILRQHGVDPTSMDVLVVKSTNHFYQNFAPLAREVIYCDAPGAGNEDLTQLPLHRVMRPFWPLDPVADCWPVVNGPALVG
jgi:microcystin degradation protein MlrC